MRAAVARAQRPVVARPVTSTRTPQPAMISHATRLAGTKPVRNGPCRAEVTGEAPAVNQIPWSPVRHDPDLLAAHAERGVAVEGYSPLKGTNLSDPILVDIARAHGVTPAQVVLRWHLEHGITVIPKSVNPERIAANFDLMRFSLEPDQVARIDTLSRHLT